MKIHNKRNEGTIFCYNASLKRGKHLPHYNFFYCYSTVYSNLTQFNTEVEQRKILTYKCISVKGEKI